MFSHDQCPPDDGEMDTEGCSFAQAQVAYGEVCSWPSGLHASGYHIPEKLPEVSVGRFTLGERGPLMLTPGRPFFPDPVAAAPIPSVGT